MIDESTPRGRIVKAAMDLAAEMAWKDVTLLAIADRAGVKLTELRAEFDGKSAIVRGFVRDIDDTVLAHPPDRPEGQSHRDTIFEVVMSRFDALEPHKAALRSIRASGAFDATLARPLIESQRWMLNAAGVGTEGVRGGVRTLGLAAVYVQVFQVWLDDEDPGMAKTMAALDQQLRRGERALDFVDDLAGALGRLKLAAFGHRPNPAPQTGRGGGGGIPSGPAGTDGSQPLS
jgi:AcrR family transcriptional regulator